ncbi:MAG: hypothetical protein ABI664_07365 [bacterium]
MTEEQRKNDSRVEAEALLGEFMKGLAANEQGSKHPPKAPRSKTPLIVLLSAALIGVVAWNAVVALRPVDVFTREELRASARVTLALAAQSVGAFRTARGRLPSSLAELGYAPDDGVSYVIEGQHFQLTVKTPTDTLTWRDTDPVMNSQALLDRMRRAGHK